MDRLPLAADAGFWPSAARGVSAFAQQLGLPPRQLQALTWVVPAGEHATLARQALYATLGHSAFQPPRVLPLASWIGGAMRRGTVARAEMYAALRATPWIRANFGAQPANLWALAQGVVQLCDELDWAASSAPDAFDRRFEASLARHFHRRAGQVMQPQSQLVLQLWHARRVVNEGPSAALRELQRRAQSAAAPLVMVVPPHRPGPDWREAFARRYAEKAPVLLIEPQMASAMKEHPVLRAAWPEMAGENTGRPIADRAVEVSGAPQPRLTVLCAESLEEEARAVAQQVLAWRRAGLASVALVVLDRLTARRVRALLERAQVLVRDETGWRLSTSSAAAAVMRWFDLVADDLYWRDFLDWLKSNFTLAGRPAKAEEVAILERAIRREGVIQGATALRRALHRFAATQAAPQAATQGAFELLDLVETQLLQTKRAGATFAAQAAVLRATLEELGMQAALAVDAVGIQVLRELQNLETDLAKTAGRVTWADFRALLATHFEETSFVDDRINSPVVMVSLTATALRPFDAALVIGADAEHLPAPPGELLFMSHAVRAELGLPTAEAALAEQGGLFAALLCTVPRVVATWRRRRRQDEPNAVSPLLERLQFVATRALGDDLVRRHVSEPLAVAALTLERPAPRAAQLSPQRLSASAAQALVDCAYRFYARHMLRLVELDEVVETPDKRDYGEALHEILSRFHRAHGAVAFHDIGAAALAASLRDHAHAVFAPAIESTPAMLGFQRRFDGLVPGYVEWLLQRSRDGWRWSASEEKHLLPLLLPGQPTVELHGRVDRIDARGDQFELIDYKARAAAQLATLLRDPGEDVQLPFYGLLLGRRAGTASYLAFERAREGEGGVKAVPAPHFEQLVDAVEARLRADLQRMAQGAPLPAIGAASTCEYCEMRGLCRRGHWESGNGTVATGEASP